MAIRHAHQTALPDDPTKDVSASKWNADHTVTFTKSELNAAVTGDNVRFNSDTVAVADITGLGSLATQSGTFSGTSSGTNTGDQTSIVGITGTKAQFDTAATDGNFQWVGDAPTAHTHTLAAGATDVTITAANLNSLDDGADTTLHFHAADRARANHTGTQLASTISDFDAAVAANSAVSANTAKTSNATHTGDVTGATTLTIAARAVTWAKVQAMATARFLGRVTASSGDVEELTAAQVKTALAIASSDVSGLGSLATLSAVPPAGSTTQIQYNNAGTLAGATEVEIEGNQLRLEGTTSLTAPSSGGVKLIGRTHAERTVPAFLSAEGFARELQTSLPRSGLLIWKPAFSVGGVFALGMNIPSATGTGTVANAATTNLHTYTPRVDYLVTTPSTTAVAGVRQTAGNCTLGGPSAGLGGFSFVGRWGPATGVATATTRAFFGMANILTAPTDVNPSTGVNCVGMGWDSGDANIQIMHNDGTGSCTKVGLGASFPRPTVDRTSLYELAMYSPRGTTQSVAWEVKNLVTGATATGTITTDMPSTSTLLAQRLWMSVGGTSSVIGIALVSVYVDLLLE